MSLVDFANVRFCYDDICAVDSVNFNVKEREILALVGPNGGGKSTILKLIAGIIRPESGRISHGCAVGYVGQAADFDISFPLTVREMVLMGSIGSAIKPYKRYTTEQKHLAESALDKVGLADLGGRGISQLSGGQLKRAVIARALACDAGLIALDEPDASLDADASKKLFRLLEELKPEVSVVIVSHNFDEALRIADRAIYVNKTVTIYDDPCELKARLEGGILL